MTTPRYKSEVRSELLFIAAMEVARKPGGWCKLTRQRIAQHAGVSEGLVSHSLGNMETIKRDIVKAAIKAEIVEIIVQSLVANDGYVNKKWLPAALKRKALLSI